MSSSSSGAADETDTGIAACGNALAGAAHADSANPNVPITAALIAPTLCPWMMLPVTVRQRRSRAPCSPRGALYETGRRIATRRSGVAGLFRKRRRFALGQRDLEHVQHVPDQRVVADDRDELDDALFAERAHRLTEALIGQPLRPEDLVASAVDKRLVLIGEHRRAAGADHLDRYRRHAGFLGKRRMRIPFVLRPPEPSRRDDRQLR